MLDWTALTKDPNDYAVGLKMQAFLASRQLFYSTSRMDFLRGYFRESRVLDIGAGEHNPAYFRPDRWEHGIISSVATRAVGVDINAEVCEFYNRKGFHFTCVDATSEADLDERFDRVFIGDVIEHVNNPVALLQFARRHLEARSGTILISTPNPFALSFLFARFRKRHMRPFFIANFEHMSWVTPTNANEIARRAGLQLTRLYFPKTPLASVRSLKAAIRWLNEHLLPAELCAREYIYEFTV